MALTILAPVVADISNALQSANKVMQLIDRQPAINTKGGLTLPRCEGSIEFSNVTVVLPPSESPALVHVSFKVEARSHAAFFGPLPSLAPCQACGLAGGAAGAAGAPGSWGGSWVAG